MSSAELEGVEALTFDVFGTVVDWLGSMTKELESKAKGDDADWSSFAKRWRLGYMEGTAQVAAGGSGPSSIDEMHRQILEEMLQEPEWARVSSVWDERDKKDLVLGWHRLAGWPDSSKGLEILKKHVIISTLSNGNVRLLVDMAKYSNLPWDVIISAEMMGSYKPNPKVYLGCAHHLSLPTSKIAMVAAHIKDLQAASALGYKTVYVCRPTEDISEQKLVKSKADGGEVDLVVNSLIELANHMALTKR